MRTTVLAIVMAVVMGLGLSLGPGTVQAAPPGYYQDQKAVYQNNGGYPDNTAYFKQMLTNIRNHIEAVGKGHVQVRVVDLGAGLDLFITANTDPDLASRIDALKAEGVQFLICGNTLKGRKLDWHTLYGVKESDIVPSGVAELIRLQQMGFFYIHI